MSTFIPAGTNVTIFGKLPNRRWRCLVEMDELISSMNSLVKDLQNSGSETNIEARLNNLPDYPLIGCLPQSVLDADFTEHSVERAMQTPSPVHDYEEVVEEEVEDSKRVCSPYSGHRRSKRTRPVKAWEVETSAVEETAKGVPVIATLEIDDEEEEEGETVVDGEQTDGEGEETDGDGVGDTTTEMDDDIETDDDMLDGDSKINNAFFRRWGSGIVIKKKLRQKGISIIVGSSSSEGEQQVFVL